MNIAVPIHNKGDAYVGQYYLDKRHGHGTYYWADGRADVGEYSKGKSIGVGAIWSKDRRKAWLTYKGVSTQIRTTTKVKGVLHMCTAKQVPYFKTDIPLSKAKDIAMGVGETVPKEFWHQSADDRRKSFMMSAEDAEKAKASVAEPAPEAAVEAEEVKEEEAPKGKKGKGKAAKGKKKSGGGGPVSGTGVSDGSIDRHTRVEKVEVGLKGGGGGGGGGGDGGGLPVEETKGETAAEHYSNPKMMEKELAGVRLPVRL